MLELNEQNPCETIFLLYKKYFQSESATVACVFFIVS